MTPAELITRRMMTRLATAGVTLPVQSLLVEALEGERKEVASSGVVVSCHVSSQLEEPLQHYAFDVKVRLCVAIDDDKSGGTFADEYDAVWAAMHYLATGDNCEELGDENDTAEEGQAVAHVFAVDGFQLTGGDEPEYEEDGNGGTWTVSFSATLTGRAN